MEILSWVLQGLYRPHRPMFLRYSTAISTGKVYNDHPHAFKNTKLQSKALIFFSATLSGNPAKTSSIPESSISVETPLVNTHRRGIYYVVLCTWYFFFLTFRFFIIKLLCKGDNSFSVLLVWLMSVPLASHVASGDKTLDRILPMIKSFRRLYQQYE